LRRRGLPPAPVLCADTTVALGRRILGKPQSSTEARAMLGDLSGREHRVLTAVAVGQLAGRASRGSRSWSALSVSRVRFDALTPTQIRRYVATGEPMGKAGAYAIQGRAALWTTKIHGSYSGIMGLPAHETAQVLAAAGIVLV
jgi:septum formation protein